MSTYHDGKRAWFTSDPAFQAGYAKGLEEAFACCEQIVRSMNGDDAALPREPLLAAMQHYRKCAIKARSPQAAPSAGEAPPAAAAEQSPESTRFQDAELLRRAKLLVLRDQPIEW